MVKAKLLKFELGAQLKDIVTGFTGIAMARTDYLTGCTHYGLASRKLKDGLLTDWQWVDETRLIRAGKGIALREKSYGDIRESALNQPGGPQPNAPEM